MKNTSILLLCQAVLSVVCGVLMSQMSFVGRMGINLMHREYLIFKIWWKTALVFFAIQFVLVLLLASVRAFSGSKFAKTIAAIFLLLGFFGAYLTYVDFTTTSHRYMRAKFHSGGYLFWVGWSVSCLYYLVSTKKKLPLSELPLEKSEENRTKEEKIR